MRSETARSIGCVPKASPVEDTIPMGNVRVSPPRKRLVPVLDVAGSTACGTIRDSNQDQYAIVELQRRLHVCDSSLPDGAGDAHTIQGYLLAVADGMGGLQCGQLASRLTLDALLRYATYHMPWITSAGGAEATALLQGTLVSSLQHCQDELQQVADDAMLSLGLGSTLTVAYLFWPTMCVLHVGDSRCYILRDAALIPATRDHTLAQAMIDRGARPDDVNPRFHHVLSNAVGGNEGQIRPDVERFTLLPSDTVILCTDGLTDQVDDATIAAIVDDADSASAASRELIARAAISGGIDNTTVIVARITAEVAA